MSPAAIGPVLEALGREWFVELTTTNVDGEWSLTLISRGRAWCSNTYRGTLAQVIARAERLDRADQLSR